MGILAKLANTDRAPLRAARIIVSSGVARAGFSIIELLWVLILASIVYAIALPVIGKTRVDASVQNSRHAVVSAVSLARAMAIRFGRPAMLRLDPAKDRMWVEADTTVSGAGTGVDTLGFFDFRGDLRVDLQSNRETLCFNGRGIGTTTAACPEAGAVIVVALNERADTVIVTPLGRVVQ